MLSTACQEDDFAECRQTAIIVFIYLFFLQKDNPLASNLFISVKEYHLKIMECSGKQML